jgi:hypothetical protein
MDCAVREKYKNARIGKKFSPQRLRFHRTKVSECFEASSSNHRRPSDDFAFRQGSECRWNLHDAGFSNREAAELLGISSDQANRCRAYAKLWLLREMKRTS